MKRPEELIRWAKVENRILLAICLIEFLYILIKNP
jgi:hypothetical protein